MVYKYASQNWAVHACRFTTLQADMYSVMNTAVDMCGKHMCKGEGRSDTV